MPISTAGIGSGIDIRNLVDNLIEAESKDKIAKYDVDEATALAKITALGSLKSTLSAFTSKLDSIKVNNPFNDKKLNLTSPISGKTIAVASATAEAKNDRYAIEVIKLAKDQKAATATLGNANTIVGTGSLVITVGANAYPVTIAENDQTVQGIVNKVNGSSGLTGVTAKLITSDSGSSIVFTSRTGLANTFTITTLDNDGNHVDSAGLSKLASVNLTPLQAADDAEVKIEGLTITSASNTLENAIQGVTLNLIETNEHDPIQLTIEDNTEAAKKYIRDFVSSFNEAHDMIKSLNKYDKNNKSNSGVLIGDATLRILEFSMHKVISERVSTLPGNITSLTELGIGTDRYTGQLTLDEDKLNEAIEKKYSGIQLIFTKDDEGVVDKMRSYLSDYVTSNGILSEKTLGYAKSIEVISEQRLSLEKHLVSLERRLLNQFIAMDKIVANLRNISDYLNTQMASLPEPMMFKKK